MDASVNAQMEISAQVTVLHGAAEPLRTELDVRPALLVVVGMVLFWGTTGALTGRLAAAVFAAAALAWGGILVLVCTRLRMCEVGDRIRRGVAPFLAGLVVALVAMAPLRAQNLMSTVVASLPRPFHGLLRGPIGFAEALAYTVLNTPWEGLLGAATLVFAWRMMRAPRIAGRRPVAFLLIPIDRMWTYVYFVPSLVNNLRCRRWVVPRWLGAAFSALTTVPVAAGARAGGPWAGHGREGSTG